MRALAIVAVLSFARTSLAQSEAGGVWTGYVGGWRPDTRAVPLTRVAAPQWVNQVPAWQVWQAAAIQQQWALQAEAQRAEKERQQLAAAAEAQRHFDERRALELEQVRFSQLEAERRAASAEREARLQLQLETERRLAAERELLARQRADAERAAAEKAKEEALEQEKKSAQAQTPGNDIYQWVDADGVVHYSTRVPEAVRGIARRVGSKSDKARE